MEKVSELFVTKIEPFLTKFNNNIIVQSMMNAFMLMMPLTIAGAFAMLLGNLPIAGYQDFLVSSGLKYYLGLPVKFTTEFMATIMSVTVAYSYLKIKECDSAIVGSLLSLVVFLILTPLVDMGEGAYAIVISQISFYGSLGIFTAIISSILVAMTYNWFLVKKFTIKMPESVPTFVSNGFSGLIPALVIIVVAVLIAFGFSMTPFGSIHTVIYGIVQAPLTKLGGTLGAVIIVAILSQLLWFFGIHGSAAVLVAVMPIWMPLDAANLAAYQAGQAIPNIISMSFFTTYTPGGFGISTAILLLLAKSQRYKSLGKLSVVPATFNITEPIIFGMPLVMNVIFFIPFVFSNVIALIIAYFATTSGLVPPTIGVSAPSGTPIILNAFMQGSWKIAALQAVLIVIVALFWYPFVRYADKKELLAEQELELQK